MYNNKTLKQVKRESLIKNTLILIVAVAVGYSFLNPFFEAYSTLKASGFIK